MTQITVVTATSAPFDHVINVVSGVNSKLTTINFVRHSTHTHHTVGAYSVSSLLDVILGGHLPAVHHLLLVWRVLMAWPDVMLPQRWAWVPRCAEAVFPPKTTCLHLVLQCTLCAPPSMVDEQFPHLLEWLAR